MLRAEVGDSAFFGGLRDYHAAHRHGTALTDDLMQALERRAGRSLGWFFDQWLRKPGYAELTTQWRFDSAAKRVELTVEQGSRFGYYRLPLTVDVTDAVGAVHRVTVPIAAQARATVTVPLALDGPPRSVTVDPAVGVLAKITAK
jgi:aminopeptidase N